MKKIIILAAALLSLASAATAANVGISQNGTNSMQVGFNVGFTVTPVNVGPDAITGATVTVNTSLPSSFSQMTVSGSGWACTAGNAVSFYCTRTGSFAAGQSIPPINISAKANGTGNFQHCANVGLVANAQTTADTTPGNNINCFSFAVTAPAGPQCLMNGNAPRFVTANGKASTQNNADMIGRNNWSNAAMSAGGPTYSTWNKAAQKMVSCSSSGSPFNKSYTCSYTAQPCK